MIALGWTLRGAEVPEPAVVVDLPGCAIVASDAGERAPPKTRLGLLVACARELEAFLPLAPASRIAVEDAMDLARRHGPAIDDRLRELRGLAQISLRATWSGPPPGTAGSAGSGRVWLQAQARRRAEGAARGGEIREQLFPLLLRVSVRGCVEREGPLEVQLAALCPRDEVAGALDHLACAIAAGDWPAETRFAVTGPWPAFSFAGGVFEPVAS